MHAHACTSVRPAPPHPIGCFRPGHGMDSTASLYCLWNVTLLLQAVEDLSCGMCDASLAFTCNTQTRQNYEAVLRRLQQGSCAFVQQEAHTRNVCPLGLRAAAAAEKLCLKRGDLAAISHGPHYNCTTEASPARATLLPLALLDTVLLPAALLLAVLLPAACCLLPAACGPSACCLPSAVLSCEVFPFAVLLRASIWARILETKGCIPHTSTPGRHGPEGAGGEGVSCLLGPSDEQRA